MCVFHCFLFLFFSADDFIERLRVCYACDFITYFFLNTNVFAHCIHFPPKGMGSGFISRSGWAVLDDRATGRLVPVATAPAGLPTWWDQSGSLIDSFDMYFHAHGDLNFRAALADWVSIMGRPAMLPRSAFGVWWSRYYPYTQQTIVDEVLSGYANFSIPLNNLVFDVSLLSLKNNFFKECSLTSFIGTCLVYIVCVRRTKRKGKKRKEKKNKIVCVYVCMCVCVSCA